MCCLSFSLSSTHRQSAKAALLCVDFSLGCSAAFNEVSASDSIKLLTVTEYSNAAARLGTDRSYLPIRAHYRPYPYKAVFERVNKIKQDIQPAWAVWPELMMCSHLSTKPLFCVKSCSSAFFFCFPTRLYYKSLHRDLNERVCQLGYVILLSCRLVQFSASGRKQVPARLVLTPVNESIQVFCVQVTLFVNISTAYLKIHQISRKLKNISFRRN